MKNVIDSIKSNCNVHLKPSKVCDGVGVFALTDIAKDTVLFIDIEPDTNFITWDLIGDIPNEIKSYLKRMCISNESGLFLNRTVSAINTSYYVNHSDNFNVLHDLKKDKYVTTRDIKSGEEILCKYIFSEIDF
jgi:SET domain-containing protein